MRDFFITGTDTGAGKTAVAGGIAGAFMSMGYDVGIMKPVQSGCLEKDGKLLSGDADFMMKAAGIKDEYDLVCPVRLSHPLCPSVAAELEGKKIDIDVIMKAYHTLSRRHEILIVEGAGGIAVPLYDDFLICDLIRTLDIPLVIVAKAGLGTINHTLLTVEYARSKNLRIIGIMINGYHGRQDEKENGSIIARIGKVPLLGIIPYDDSLNVEKTEIGDIITLIKRHLDINTILSMI